MSRKDVIFAVCSFALFMLLTSAILLVGQSSPAQAGPLPAPTPLITGYSDGPVYYPVKFWSSQTITSSRGSSIFVLAKYEAIDVQYNIDQGTTPNTITLKLQHSNDGVNWTDGATLVSNNAADASVLNQALNFGIYTRAYATVENSEPVVVTVTGLAK